MLYASRGTKKVASDLDGHHLRVGHVAALAARAKLVVTDSALGLDGPRLRIDFRFSGRFFRVTRGEFIFFTRV